MADPANQSTRTGNDEQRGRDVHGMDEAPHVSRPRARKYENRKKESPLSSFPRVRLFSLPETIHVPVTLAY